MAKPKLGPRAAEARRKMKSEMIDAAMVERDEARAWARLWKRAARMYYALYQYDEIDIDHLSDDLNYSDKEYRELSDKLAAANERAAKAEAQLAEAGARLEQALTPHEPGESRREGEQ